MKIKELIKKYPNIVEADIDILDFIDLDSTEDEINELIDNFTKASWDNISDMLQEYKIKIGNKKCIIKFRNKDIEFIIENGVFNIIDWYNTDTMTGDPQIFTPKTDEELWNDLVYYSNEMCLEDFTGIEEQSYNLYYYNKVEILLKKIVDSKD